MNDLISYIIAFSVINFTCFIFLKRKEPDYKLKDRLYWALVTELGFMFLIVAGFFAMVLLKLLE